MTLEDVAGLVDVASGRNGEQKTAAPIAEERAVPLDQAGAPPCRATKFHQCQSPEAPGPGRWFGPALASAK